MNPIGCIFGQQVHKVQHPRNSSRLSLELLYFMEWDTNKQKDVDRMGKKRNDEREMHCSFPRDGYTYWWNIWSWKKEKKEVCVCSTRAEAGGSRLSCGEVKWGAGNGKKKTLQEGKDERAAEKTHIAVIAFSTRPTAHWRAPSCCHLLFDDRRHLLYRCVPCENCFPGQHL